MIDRSADGVLYWDTSAVLSVLFEDKHTPSATEELTDSRVHLMSSLAWSEAHAVMGRLRRDGAQTEAWLAAALDMLGHGPWQRITAFPDWEIVRVMASRWPLRGADLWHLAMSKTLQRDLPELRMVTYDAALSRAAEHEGLA